MFESREGQHVPEAEFRFRDPEGASKTTTSTELFSGRTVVVFSLPGAFTPTCSSSHVPRYEELYDELRARGVDDVVCISVNDLFVMDAWKQAQGADRVLFMADADATFTRGMGMLADKSEAGLGSRSWRYSMLVRDGTIEQMFVEPERPGDPFSVSDADTMLAHLGGTAPYDIVVFSRSGCGHCARAKRLLNERGLPFSELPTSPRILRALPGENTTPQIFVDGRLVGGADDLAAWLDTLPREQRAS